MLNIEEILDKEIPAGWPSIVDFVSTDFYSIEDRIHTDQGSGFWEQRLTFLLIVQEAITS